MWTTPTRCPQSHEAEQNQKKRTYEVLPKPDNLIRYRQRWPSFPTELVYAGAGRPGAIALNFVNPSPEGRTSFGPLKRWPLRWRAAGVRLRFASLPCARQSRGPVLGV